jgi:hypothetical protein
VAIALFDKVNRDSATVFGIVRHRGNKGNAQLRVERSALLPLRDTANAGGAATAPPL